MSRWPDNLKTLRTFRLAVSLVASSGRATLVVIIGATAVTSAAIAGQLLVGRALLNLLADGETVDVAELTPYLVVLGALLITSALSQAVATELRLPLGERVYRLTMDQILDVATEVELEAYESADFADRLQRARLGAGGQSQAVVFGLVSILSTSVIAAGIVVVLLSVSPVLVPLAVIGYVPITLVNVRKNRARYRLERDLTELQRERAYLEYLMSDRAEAKELRSYNLTSTLRAWHAALWDERLVQLRALVRDRLVLSVAASSGTTLVLIITLSIALILAGRGSITIGDAAIAIVGLQQLNSRMQGTGAAFGSVHEGLTFLQDFESFRATLPAIREQRPSAVPPSCPAVLAVNGICYRYPGSTVDALKSVGFEVRRGQTLAIVGANGSGKSTLAKLLCRLLPPTQGSITWDGVDIATCDPMEVRKQISPVFQDYSRYMFTIRRVIGLGSTERIDDEPGILKAASNGGVSELIDSSPAGLDTRLGKMFTDGTDVSIGQWQRLAIARALFRDAPIVVLDEPSASLDPRAEADLFDLLQSLCSERIVIFVSHRLATVRSADIVLVLDEGEVAEVGSHQDLMNAGGLYHDLFQLQASRYGIAG